MKTGSDFKVLLFLPVAAVVVAMMLPLVRTIREWIGG